MAHEVPDLVRSYIAGADLSGNQFQAVNLNGSGQMVAPSAGGAIVGVLQSKPTSGRVGAVVIDGVSKMKTGTGGLAAGALVAVDNTGKAVAAATGNVIVGRCETAATAGNIASVLLLPMGAVA